MKIIIIGAGKVGFSMAQLLSRENHDVTVVEQDPDRQQVLEEELDIQVVAGSGSSTSVLEAAGVRQADMLLAVTEFDELNMVSCLLGKQYGVKTTVARVRNPEYLEVKAFSLNEAMGIDMIINPERVTATEIAQIVQNPEALNVDFYADGKVQLVELEVGADSPLLGKKIKQLDSSVPYNIVSIHRQHSIMVPGGEDSLEKGDHINVMARSVDMAKVERLLGFHARKVENVTIMGGGRTGYYLAQILEKQNPSINIKIIERDRERARQISNKLKHSLVINGDGSDYQLLEEENIGASDFFAAVTDDDKINLLCALIARNLGVKKTACQVKRTDVLPLIEQLGIDTILCPRLLTAGVILKYIRVGDIISVTVFDEDRAEILELFAQPGAVAVDKELKNIKFPTGSVIGAVVRENNVYIPDGSFRIKPHDRLIVFSLARSIHKVEKLFLNGGKKY
ncbi:Trk system potassium transporter TrkA [Syntrophomonas palmitatica]|uniref:Trk system potassium transporter TrkA n=1 Tax=Syntrophomonas palmitatica TaxID=402877 RepID=UPI0006D013DA|nr:Trk system potassium transporter TrkA [Syntrophomonas palmitatica]